MTESHGYRATEDACPDCVARGGAEWLHSNGTRTLCTNPWCGYDITRDPEPEPGTQPMLV